MLPAVASDRPPAGLTSDEAGRRLASAGPNDITVARRMPLLRQGLALLTSPLVLILLVATIISASLRQHADAAIIVGILLVGSVINLWQTHRAERIAAGLRDMVTPTATVFRDGCWREIARRQVVTGDLFRLVAGDLVPADGRLVDARDLAVQQSALTGESLPVDKHAASVLLPGEAPDEATMVFLGTSVVSGTGSAVVTATGGSTVFGDIARRLGSRAPESEFDRGLRQFSLLILRTTIALVLLIALIGLVLKREPLEALLFAVALGVGLTPEFLPMIQSVTLTAGAARMARAGVIVKHVPAIQNLGSVDVFCTDKTGTLTIGDMLVERSIDPWGHQSTVPLQLAALNSRFGSGIKSPLDAAIIRSSSDDCGGAVKVDEVPFDFDRRRVSVIVETAEGRRRLITKGAPESILPVCRDVPSGAADVARRLSGEGLRLLAIASRDVERREAYQRDDEADLTLNGFIAFADPIRDDAAETVRALRRDGVAVKILTGDNDLVAGYVASRVGLDGARVVTGDELQKLDDSALGHVAEDGSVFARVSPSQKNRILMALKHRGHVVGYLGDGINDAPSLHTADVGIAVRTAADVARDAAGIIISDANLRVLHRAILEGRRASGNMMKYLLMETSSNFGNMFSMAVASMFLPFLPMLPTQILLNNFLYDFAQITIPTDAVDQSYVRAPRRWDMSLIRDFMIFVGPVSSLFDFLTFYVLLRILHASETLFHTGWFVESLVTQTCVLFVIRTFGNPLKSLPSIPLAATTLLVIAAGFLLPVMPFADALGLTPLPLTYIGFVVAAVLTYLLLVEGVKRALMARRASVGERH